VLPVKLVPGETGWKSIMSYQKIAVTVSLFVSSSLQLWAADGVIPGKVLRATIAKPSEEYSLRSLAVSADGKSADLIVAKHLIDQAPTSATLHLVIVDELGRVSIKEKALALKAGSSILSAGLNFAEPSNEKLLLSPPGAGEFSISKVSETGEIATVANIGWNGVKPVVRKMTAIGGNRVRLLGEVGGIPVIAEVDANGKVLTETKFQSGAMSLVSVVSQDDGSYVAAGEKGTHPMSSTWIAKVVRDGKATGEVSYPGRPLDFTRGTNGEYLLIVETVRNGNSEIVAKGLKADYSQSWSRVLASGQKMGPSFRVVALPSGGFVIAGVKDRGLWISRVTAAGVETWTEAHAPGASAELEMTLNVEMEARQGMVHVAYSAFIVEGRRQHQVVRTIRFEAQ